MIGKKVLLFQEGLLVGEISRVLIDSQNGSFAGLEVFSEKEKGLRYVPPAEIKGFGRNFVLIKNIDSLSLADDVVVIKKALDEGVKIVNARVYYEDGRYIGKVDDATINLKIAMLEKIYINPKLSIKFLSEYLIISAKMIVKIEPKKITVKDDRPKVSKKNMIAVPSPVSE